VETSKQKLPMVEGHYEDLRDRGINEKTCRFWQYQVGEFKGQPVHIANYRDSMGQKIAQKLRTPDKKFAVAGDGSNMPLYGQWLWGQGGKYICVTEGEIDALSVSQAMGNKWPVVSLPHGAASAGKDLGRNLEWLDTFDHIVLMFDMDRAGRHAVEEATKVLPAGKVKIANLPDKDANATLLKHGTEVLLNAFWKAKDWRPDGIVSGEDISRERLKSAVARGYELPYPLLNQSLMGIRKREITLLAAGTGIGKSTLAREVAYHLHQEHGLCIGNVYLEEGIDKTVQAYVAIHNNINLKNLRFDPSVLSDEDWDRSLKEVIHEHMFFYDHFGSLDSNSLMLKLRYLATVAKVDFIVLDHISIVVSGMESQQGERKDIDVFMTRLRSLVEETGVGVIAVVHLNQPDGTPHEEGGRVTLKHLRGSGSLKQLSDNVLALERDQQGKNPTHAQQRLLKCRETGETGLVDLIDYNRTTGRYELVTGFETVGHETQQKADFQ
jgi:twinkle protein